MNEELKIIIKAVTDSAQKAIKEVNSELEKVGASSKKSSGGFSAAMKGFAKGAAIAVAAIAAVGAAIVALGKKSLEYIKINSKLMTAFQSIGASAGTAEKAYTGLYRFLGDSGKATEAASHLALIARNQEQLAEWTKISQGIYARFGDSLPIEGLTEAANETLRVGKVTGTLADALNWAGVSEDEFNEKLAQTTTYEEREVLLRTTLNGLYSEAAEIYEKNNKALLDYNESQARLDKSMAEAGAVVTPLLTALNNLSAVFFDLLKPALEAIIPPITTFVNWITQAVQSVSSFFGLLTGKSTSVSSTAKSIGTAAKSAQTLGNGMENAKDAANGVADAVEKAKRSIMGFDELNILATSSANSANKGQTTTAPNYATNLSPFDNGVEFTTEVKQTENVLAGMMDRIKQLFSQLATIFEPSIKAWTEAWETIKDAWNEAKPHFINGAKEIWSALKTLCEYLVTDFVPSIVNSFSVNLAPVIADVFSFLLVEVSKIFEWLATYVNKLTNDVLIPGLDLIKKLVTDTFQVIGDVWKQRGDKLLSELSTLLDGLRGFIDQLYNNTIKPIWDKILEVVKRMWDSGLKPLVQNIIDSVLNITNMVVGFYNQYLAPIVAWFIDNVVPALTAGINKILDIVGDIVVHVSNAISGVVDVCEGLVQFIIGVFTGDWESAWEGIQTVVMGVWEAISEAAYAVWDTIRLVFEPLEEFFKTLWDNIKGVFFDVVDWFKQLFENAWTEIKRAWENPEEYFAEKWEGIKESFAGCGEWFEEKFNEARIEIEEEFSDISDWFSERWTAIKKVLEPVDKWMKEKFEEARVEVEKAWENPEEYFSEKWEAIKDVFEPVTAWFKKIFTDAIEEVKKAWSNPKAYFSEKWEGIKQVFNSTPTWFKKIFTDAWTNIKNVFNDVVIFFQGIWNKIKNTFSRLGTDLGSAIGGSVKSGVNSVISMVERTLNDAVGIINGAISLINRIPGVYIGSIGGVSLPKLARGGITAGPTTALIGEAGREAVLPLDNNTEWMDKLADRIASRNNTPTKIVLQLGEKEFGWATINAINGITSQTGRVQLAI